MIGLNCFCDSTITNCNYYNVNVYQIKNGKNDEAFTLTARGVKLMP